MKKILFVFLFTLIIIKLYSQENLSINFSFNSENEIFSPGNLNVNIAEPKSPSDLSTAVKIFLIITIISLAPSIFILCTSFIRIIIVFSILKQAIGLPQLPPGQVIVGFAIFLTVFNMFPVFEDINKNAFNPYQQKKISWDTFIQRAQEPLKKFMLTQTRDEDLAVFISMLPKKPASRKDLSLFTIIPAYVLSELKTGFQIGFIIYIPFLMIDMIIASILMSMGMLMLPPIMISLPFKILLFVLIDGWKLITETLIRSFH